MPGSVYKVVELIGTSPESWEDAARRAIESAAHTLKDLRIAELVKADVRLDDNQVVEYRVKLSVSFRYHAEMHH